MLESAAPLCVFLRAPKTGTRCQREKATYVHFNVAASRSTYSLVRNLALCVLLSALNVVVVAKFAGVLYRAALLGLARSRLVHLAIQPGESLKGHFVVGHNTIRLVTDGQAVFTGWDRSQV